MEKRRLVDVAILAAVPFVMVLGNSMLIPVFPQLKKAMDLTPFEVGLLITVFSVPAAIVIPFAGVLSDHVGRRPVIAVAMATYGLGGLIAGAGSVLIDNPYAVVLAGRVVQGIGAGGTYLLAVALAGDIFTDAERTRALGILEAANGFGKVVSPILGAAVALIVWWAPFFVYGVLALPVAALVWLIIKEPPIEQGRGLKGYGKALVNIFKKRGMSLVATYLAGMLALFLLFGVLSFLSDELEQRYDVRGFASGLVLAIPVATMAATAYAAGTYFENHLRMLKPVILVSSGVSAAALGVSALFVELVPFMAALAVLGIAIGAMLPAINMLVTSAAGQEERGVVTSLYGAVRFIGVAIGPPTFALVLEAGRSAMLGGAAVCAIIVLVLAWWLVQPDKLLVAGGDDDDGGEGGSRGKIGKEKEGSGALWRELEGES